LSAYYIYDIEPTIPIKQGSHGATRPSSISSFNCYSISECFLFVIFKTILKKFANFIFFRGFSKLHENETFLETQFEILIIHKPFLSTCELPQKSWALSVLPFLDRQKN